MSITAKKVLYYWTLVPQNAVTWQVVSVTNLVTGKLTILRHTRVGSGANAKQQITLYFRLNYHSTFYDIKITDNGIKLPHVI